MSLCLSICLLKLENWFSNCFIFLCRYILSYVSVFVFDLFKSISYQVNPIFVGKSNWKIRIVKVFYVFNKLKKKKKC